MSEYLDGELPPAGLARMQRHLDECADCRRLLAGLRQTVDALHRLSGAGVGIDAVQIAASVRVRLSRLD
jgi:anti-sigma factor RsiW